jgi:hypothetical protein
MHIDLEELGSLVCPLMSWSEEDRWGRYPRLRKCLAVVFLDLRSCFIVKACKEDQVTDIQHVAKDESDGDEGKGCSLSLCRVNRGGWMLQGDYYYSSRHEITCYKATGVLTPSPHCAYLGVYSDALLAFLCKETDWFCCKWRRAPCCSAKLPQAHSTETVFPRNLKRLWFWNKDVEPWAILISWNVGGTLDWM